jgi:hypothetical protein
LWVLVLALVACGCNPEPETQSRAPEVAKPAPKKPAVPKAPKAPREDRFTAIGDTSKLLPPVQRMCDPADHFEPPEPPRPGDWRYEHRERPQSFDAFIRSKPNVPYPGKATIT